MKLLDLTEPFFQYCCRLNRSARKHKPPPENVVRVELQQQFEAMRQKSMQMGGTTHDDYQAVEPALVLFVDAMIRDSALPFASTWAPIALDHPGLDNEQRFFDLIDENLAQQGPSADERLAVLFTCLGLGFSGGMRPEMIRPKLKDMSARLRGVMDSDLRSEVCPEAYASANQTNYIEAPAKILGAVLITLVGLTVVLLAANVFLFISSSRQLQATLESIQSIAG